VDFASPEAEDGTNVAAEEQREAALNDHNDDDDDDDGAETDSDSSDLGRFYKAPFRPKSFRTSFFHSIKDNSSFDSNGHNSCL
jgi:hypothetical protein